MAKHYLLRFIILIVVSLFALNYFSPETYQAVKEKATEFIDDLVKPIEAKKDETAQIIQNVSDLTIINQTTYLKLGGIITEVPCIDNQECNTHKPECSNNCLCEEGECLKPI